MSKYKDLLAAMTPEERARLEQRLRAKGKGSKSSTGAAGGTSVMLSSIPRREDAGAAPLSFAQERFAFLEELAPGRAVYNISTALRIEGSLDAAALERSLDDLVARHEALRTTLDLGSEPGRQIVHPAASAHFPLERVTLDASRSESGNGNGGGGGDGALREMLAREAERSFDWVEGPLARGLLVRSSDDAHVLQLTFHHAIADAWSLAVLVSELFRFYGARAGGRDPELPELPVQYGDFAAWQRTRVSEQRLEEQLGHWRRALEGASSGVTLPPDRPRPKAPSLQGAHESFTFSRDLLDRLKATARAEGVSLNMLLVAGFAALIARTSGEEDLVIGSAVAGRDRPEVEGIVGPLANTLPLRLDLSGDPTVRELLSRVRSVSLDAYSSQDVPLEKLVVELEPERDPGLNPLFQVVLSLQIAPDAGAGARAEGRGGLRITRVDVESRRAHLDLAMTLAETAGGLVGALEYATDLYDRDTIQRTLKRFERLLEASTEPSVLDGLVSDLPLLDDEEAGLLEDFSGRNDPVAAAADIPTLFEAAREGAPGRVAVEDDRGALSYSELDRRANGIAWGLARSGVGRGDVVAVLLPRSRELVVALLGILKSGAAYLAIDSGYPAERKRFLLADAKVRVVVTSKEAWHQHDDGTAPFDGVTRVMVETAEPRDTDTGPRAGPGNADELAYVCYTSGSTGEPKGVLVTHRGVVRLVKRARYATLDASSRVLHMAPPSFDASTFEIWGPLLNGGAVVVPGEGVPSASELARTIDRHEVTTLWLTAGLFNALVDERADCLARAREVLVGGEALSAAHVRRAQAACPETRFVNGYGPTEGTTFTACHRIPAVVARESIPIGEPLTGTRVYVLDRYGHPVPIGVVGELFLGGDGLARGYLGRPARTAERFEPDPFSGLPGARMYRTGDAVRWLPDGTLDYVGRLDDQVKLRGYRVEPGEVEAVLTAHPDVRDAAVTVTSADSSSGERRLVGYVVLSRRGGLGPLELNAHASERLPDYMVPQIWVELEALPLTRNGKLDRAALPAPSASRPLEGPSVDPRSPVEEALAEIWKEVLAVERVGVHDDFFELGGHSLIAMRMMARARDVLRAELPLRKIFETPTVAGLAEHVEEQRRRGRTPTMPPLARLDGEGWRPLSFAQQRLWILDQVTGASPAYHVPTALRLRGALDRRALDLALDAIVARQGALRTRFASEGETPLQRPEPGLTLALPVVDLGGLDAEDRAQETRRALVAHARRPFELTRDPLARLLLVQESAIEHVLQLTMHHIVSDAWSLGVFWRELGTLYGAALLGDATSVARTLAPLPIQYDDYAAWQRSWMRDGVLDELLDYWRDVFPPGVRGTELPPDHIRPTVPAFRGGRRTLLLDAESSDAIRRACRAEGVTLFMMLLAGFQTTLHRKTGQRHVVVGTPTANRGVSAAESLIGFFANSLALRTDMSGAPTFEEVLARVREMALGAYAHQDVPFEKIVEAVSPERDAKRNPLFQITFALQSVSVALPELSGLKVSGEGASAGATRFDLEVHVFDRPEGLRVVAAYDAELYEPETIERLLRGYRTLMTAAVSEPETPVAELSLLDDEERRLLLDGRNATAREFPSGARVEEVFAARVAERPDAVAIELDGATWTYRELDARSDQIAARLREAGVSRESPVGVLGERCLQLYAALLGVLKAGGAYVPLDPSYPEDRLAFMMEDAGLEALLVDASFAALASKGSVSPPVIVWDDAAEGLRVAPASPSPTERLGRSGSELAYLMYTSGSTGVPKAVGVTHRAILRLLFGVDYVALGPAGRVLQLAPVSFDASTFEIWGALLKGGALVVHPERIPTAERLRRTLVDGRVSTLWLTASLFNALVDEEPSLFASTKELLVGGEALSAPHIRRAQRHCPDTVFVNGYGPTEGTTFTCCYRIPTPLAEGLASLPIGAPIANTRVYVLDDELELCPYGAAGELYIGGDGLARGYWDRPDLTAERFVPHPFGEPGERLYRTGDVVRWLASGALEYLGRLDGQVKLRGFRVELGEVEAALRADPRVSDAAAVVREDVPGDKRLVAYVALQSEAGTTTTSELRKRLSDRLPEYMIPQIFVTLPALPLTANGKIDREKLPAPGDGPLVAEGSPTPARGPIEEGLAEIFQDLLDVDRVGVHDDFFDLGGHSLLATVCVARIKKAFRVELTLRHFFEAPSVSGLAGFVTAHYDAGCLSSALPLPRLAATDDRPLSFAQQRLWFLAELDPSSTAYNIPATFRLEGPLEVRALEEAFAGLLARHHALRTVFVKTGGRAVQRVLELEELPPALPFVDLSALEPQERSREASRLAEAEARTVFDLSRDPMARARLVRLQPNSYQFTLSVHHIASDGWSHGILYRELEAFYLARREGREPDLPALPVQYADYAAWQRQWLSGKVLESHLDYWRGQLQGAEVLELPTDHPRPAVQTFEGRWESTTMSSQLRSSLKTLAQEEGVTMFMTLLAAFQTLLHRYTGQDDIVVGTPVANRTRSEIEPLVGFFANNLVMRAGFSGAPHFREVLARVRDVALGAYSHQEIPFERLVDELAPERSLSRSPLFQVVFALHSAEGAGLSLDGVTAASRGSRIRTTRFDLELYLWDRADGLTAVCFYNTSLFEAASIRRLLAHFRNLVTALARTPEIPVAQLPIIGDDERNSLLAWSGGRIEDSASIEPSHRSLTEAFDAACSRFPERVALTLPGTKGAPSVELTYEELSRRSRRLAAHLVELGVGSEVLVGVCLERTPALLVSVLGILRAGGAYVPLDPSYPEERLRTMVEDSGLTLVVTEPSHRARFSRPEIDTVLLDAVGAFDAEVPAESDANADLGPDPGATPSSGDDNLAYVIYTSGSSGRPKGVGVTHRNALRLFSATRSWFRFDETDVFTLFHSYAFDFSVWEMFGALLNGGRLVVVPYWLSREPDAFYDLLERERVTVLSQTPSAFRQLVSVDEGRAEQGSQADLAVRAVVFGGEALELSSLAPWVRRHGDRPRLVNMYGITETTVHVTYREITPADVDERRGSVIGRPIPDLSTYVLDERLEPSPCGVRGEIYVAGLGLARGYLGRPDLTAERFLPDPHASVPGSRIYRTGDLGRYLADGDIEYLGRADQQVKVRGFRIELGEIESVLATFDGVRDGVARLVPSPSGGRLAAYVVPEAGASIDVASLRAHLARRLPEYMVPSAIVSLDALPLTPQGKLDVGRLPATAEAQASARRPVAEPASPYEAALADIWKEVLGLGAVGADDNFFELGGDSILSIQVVAKAAERGMSLTVRHLFQHQTLRELATVASETRSEPPRTRAEQEPVEGSCPLTPIQRWFFEQAFVEPHHYNQSMLLELPEGFQGEHLPEVLSALVSRHDALRLTFSADASAPGGVRQEHTDRSEAFWHRVDLTSLAGASETERRAAVAREAGRAQAGLDLAKGPLARWLWLDFGPGAKGRLLWVIHHLVVDGVSWRILLADFEKAYRKCERGEPVSLARKTSSYRSWAEHLAAHGGGDALASELDYWVSVSEGSRPLPTDHPPEPGANREAHVDHVIRHLTEEETTLLLRELPARLRTEVNEVLLSALAAAVGRVAGEEETLVTLEGHGREEIFEDVDVTETVGWFTSLFPVRLPHPGGKSPLEVLDEVRLRLRRLPNKGIGYGVLRYASERGGEALRASTPPSVSFNYLGQFDGSVGGESFLRTAPESVGSVRSSRGERPHRIDVTAVVSQGRLSVDWMYSRKLHESGTIRELSEVFLDTLRALIAASSSAERRYQASDFSLAEIDQERLQKLLTKKLGNRQ